MFDQLVVSASNRKKKGRWPYFTATATIWMMALAMIVATGIFAYDARLSEQYEIISHIILPPPSPPPGPKASAPPRAPKQQPSHQFQSYKEAPTTFDLPPKTPPRLPDVGNLIYDDGSGDRSDSRTGIIGGIGGGNPLDVKGGGKTAPPPPPVPPERNAPEKAAPQATTVRRTSVVLQGSAIRRVKPVYPPLARRIPVSGAVVVEVTINEQGDCVSARALSGHVLLRDVSEKAALGWKWKPTFLNGVPVKVIGTITFNFQL